MTTTLTTTFITWPAAIDADFRTAYFSTVGETIQTAPETNNTEDRFLVGSSRLTPSGIESLSTSHPDATFSNTPPADWIKKVTAP